MEVNGHVSVITNDKILIITQRLFVQVPSTPEEQIRFREGLSVDVNNAVMELHRFTWQSDNAFEIHYLLAGHPDADNVETLGGGPAVGQRIHEASVSGLIHGEHAVTSHSDRKDNGRTQSNYHDNEEGTAYKGASPVATDTNPREDLFHAEAPHDSSI